MKAVHFGAGNIGRGFVGWLLHDGGYEVVFSDVAVPLVDAIKEADSYVVHEAGPGGVDRTVTGFRAVNSKDSPEALVDEIASADVVTTAVGPTILPFIAQPILDGIRARRAEQRPLQVMACENAIGGTDILRAAIEDLAGGEWKNLSSKAVFANTAVDRIVPAQAAGQGIDVTVEPFFEWAIEQGPFDGDLPTIPGAHFVDDLTPYIERKLFTVNTGHAATAYFGASAGAETIAEALAKPEIADAVAAALEETSALLEAKHSLPAEELREYRETILNRFRNPELPDTVWRVGRQPMRKLSRHERFVGPAAEAAERGLSTVALVAAMSKALRFDDPDDEQSVELQTLLNAGAPADDITQAVTGLNKKDALYPAVLAAVEERLGV